MKNTLKKKSIVFFILFSLASFSYAHKLGDKVYKEVIVDGEKVSKWLTLYSITEYDSKGNEIHYKFQDIEGWYEYDYHPNGKVKQKLMWKKR